MPSAMRLDVLSCLSYLSNLFVFMFVYVFICVAVVLSSLQRRRLEGEGEDPEGTALVCGGFATRWSSQVQ